ncbi:hypothetical protein BCR33DRAFT_857259 [Rhizoclosmatium globosum]|uniref:ABC transporter domain-containing protein n=1 Tax=Rhizoclosmatium globosum TaxID=329046 RepID=A0A1Y2B853_9FUNG|nr:hypothetical protein BCR33DRAFT_857259 [Rhizoclosmatium globosum]|eukprot:ORY30710.1 hypothetical protein BCR33DRAFT_857259 [Rhizoclosmatium globosum]
MAIHKGHQLRALIRKSISVQSRQIGTNVCCILLCPLLMVGISAVMGVFIAGLIQRSQSIENILYCSANSSLNDGGWPVFKAGDSHVYGSNVTNGKQVNYYNYIKFGNLNAMQGPPGASVYNFNHPCVVWFGDSYPQNSPVYERNANLTGIAKMDASYIPPPDGGWITQFNNMTNKAFDFTTFRWFTQFQQANWAVVGARPGLESVLGSLPDKGKLTPAQAVRLNASTFLVPKYNESAGILGSIPQRIFANFTVNTNNTPSTPTTAFNATVSESATATVSSTPSVAPYLLSDFQLYPYFESNSSIKSVEDVDTVISDKLYQMIADLARLDKSVLTSGSSNTAKIQKFQLAAEAVTQEMPYGAIFLDEFDVEALRAKLFLFYGNDMRISASSNFPSSGFRLLENLALLDQALLRATAGANKTLARGTVTQGLRIFPDVRSTEIKLPIGGYIGRILYPFGVSFLLPIFVIMLVKEKEDRIQIMMQMNGVKPWAYYVTHYMTFFVLFISSTFIFIIIGFVSKLDMFTKTSPLVLITLFFLWGNVQISLAFCGSTLFSKSRIALVMTFLVVLVGVVISLVLSNLYNDSVQLPVLNIWPPFAFYRGLSLMNTASYSTDGVPFGMWALTKPGEFRNICGFLFFEILVYGALAGYLSAVVPTEFGVVKPWHFPITEPISWITKLTKSKTANQEGANSAAHHSSLSVAGEYDAREDDDVRAERLRVNAEKYGKDATIIVNHMRKVYPSRKGLGPKIAVRDVTFAEEKGTIFGLLGPNGAGKTTLISILTGLYENSGGSARLAGFDTKTQTAQVYQSIGVCPQFDIHWEDLSVEEHLYFYARLKGIGKSEEREAVNRSLEQVSLEALRSRLAKRLSGGEKRRLSIAIALLGNPQVVFLDEPTTGLDPQVRRLIWNIIQNARDNKTIILTTHSMEEAEALCHRIGLMCKGSLRCIAQPLRLKELYGTGFKLSFHSLAEDTARACDFVESILPSGWNKVDAFSTNTAYEFPAEKGRIGELFEIMEREKERSGIQEWGISQTGLEDVFIRIISDDDANAD